MVEVPVGGPFGSGDLSRRRFLASALVLPWLAAPLDVALRDPRLTVRPRRPSLTPDHGETRLGPELRRGAILYVPERYSADRPAPLVVALHGGGGSAARWTDWYPACEERGMILLAPDARARTWDRVGGDFGPDVRFLDSALRYTFERCAIDPAQVALAGFSDGASYALSLGPSNGDLFTHIIAFSPGFSDPTDPIVGRPRVFMSHGTQDRSLPIAGSRAIAPMFELDGYDVRYDEFEGGHEMPSAIVQGALDWFLA
jgi:phospholipase/carboxylesterase